MSAVVLVWVDAEDVVVTAAVSFGAVSIRVDLVVVDDGWNRVVEATVAADISSTGVSRSIAKRQSVSFILKSSYRLNEHQIIVRLQSLPLGHCLPSP